ncbi:hypothetical protein DFH09DRAFT_1080854 [Mycena vulgaris]|nr:hypothetical protein DFH09DRAFT_1080854 [Mycena vulgaris]
MSILNELLKSFGPHVDYFQSVSVSYLFWGRLHFWYELGSAPRAGAELERVLPAGSGVGRDEGRRVKRRARMVNEWWTRQQGERDGEGAMRCRGRRSDGRAFAWPGSRGFGLAWSGFGSMNYQAGPPHLALAWPGLALA